MARRRPPRRRLQKMFKRHRRRLHRQFRRRPRMLGRGYYGCYRSRLRSRVGALICVGLAYFVIAVIVPDMILAEAPEPSTYGSWGTVWSLAGGALGAVGA